MILAHVPYFVAGWIFLWGFYGVVTSKNLVHQVICLTVVQTSTYILLLAIGFKTGARLPCSRICRWGRL